MFRHSASASAIVCSAAAIEFDSGAFATITPRLVAASMSTLSTPVPARPITFSRCARSIRSGGHLGRRADQDRVEIADPLGERLGVPVEPDLDVELGPQQVDAGVGDLLLDEDPGDGSSRVRSEDT